MKSISFIICSNGYGHTKRAAKVLNELIQRNLGYKLNVICNSSKISFLKSNIKSKFQSIHINTSLMDSEPNWLNSIDLNFSKYKQWSSNFAISKTILNSDLIVSDNYVTTLGIKKTFILGSFLWLDILNDFNEESRKISQYEKKILEKYYPEMISVENMYNNSVDKLTRVFPVPWFESRKVYEKPFFFNSILVTAGGTNELDISFIKLIEKLALDNKQKKIFLDSNLYKKIKTNKKIFLPNVSEFDFTEISFKKIDAVICRPGIGILTDCMAYLIPVISVYSNKNSEIIFNAKKIVSQKIGISVELKKDFIDDYNYSIIYEYINSKSKLDTFTNQIKHQKMGGHLLAANKIINTINNE